jgi:hypothetical protein
VNWFASIDLPPNRGQVSHHYVCFDKLAIPPTIANGMSLTVSYGNIQQGMPQNALLSIVSLLQASLWLDMR